MGVLAITTYFGDQLRKYYDNLDKDEEYELIRKFLLNDALASSLQEKKKPKLWIHTVYHINARNWKSFGSPTSTDLNQPYLHLTIESIVQHCSDSFHICLIDDDSFSKLIPSWSVDMATVAEPFRRRCREYGLATLLHMYGGMVIPNSFVCFRDLLPMYQEHAAKPFVGERYINNDAVKRQGRRLLFLPDTFVMGCKQGNLVMASYAKYLWERCRQPHFQTQVEFLADSNDWLLRAVESGDFALVDGTLLGVKTMQQTPVMLEDLFEEEPLDLSYEIYGVFLPAEDILKRTKYMWLAYLSPEELYKNRSNVAKYLSLARYEGAV